MKLLPVYLVATLALLVSADNESTGCYSNPGSIEKANSYTYQSPGHCSKTCQEKGAQVAALHKGAECWCGDSVPAKKYLASDDECNTDCLGWPLDKYDIFQVVVNARGLS
ncbi:hypothetical protein EYZ11_006192 [Aspergillus tanneri]|uniref:WSC domain-containing protein n=1 Tax=Aspergillus tanneri TaxID=1220188 RepID=A0A4S3JG21_9EURO|nr:hypothetical protein EYZ11_006192 [Aspergillus tanneri]